MKELHICPIDGTDYGFRTPTAHDLPKVRRVLTLQGLRRPASMEFKVAGLAGIAALGELAGDPAEAERQKGLFEEWYALLPPIVEDDIDEPDLELRAVELSRQREERRVAQAKLLPDVAAIEANLSRHWPPYRELLADRGYYDDISEIELVRALLVRIGEGELTLGPDGFLSDAAYQLLPRAHRTPLAQFASGLLVPNEETRKN